MKITLFKKENNFGKKNFVLNPNIFWEFSIIFIFIFFIFSAFFGYNLFTQINQESVLIGDVKGGNVPSVKEERMKRVLDYFTSKENKSLEILNSKSPVIDPSL